MTAKHLKGAIRLDHENAEGSGMVALSNGNHSAFAQVVWRMEGDKQSPECEATAQRLVDCWNACETLAIPAVSIPSLLRDRAAIVAEVTQAMEAKHKAVLDAARALLLAVDRVGLDSVLLSAALADLKLGPAL